MTQSSIQETFFNDIVGSEVFEDNRSLYQELVYDQFEDVLRSSLPLFTASIPSEELEYHIKNFISIGAKSPYIWKMPSEFADFMVSKPHSRQAREQLRFDSCATKLYMSPHIMRRASRLSKERRVALSKTARTLRLDKSFFVVYRHRTDNEVYTLEITKTLNLFLKLLKNRYHFERIVLLISHKMAIRYKELFPLLAQARDDFYTQGILE